MSRLKEYKWKGIILALSTLYVLSYSFFTYTEGQEISVSDVFQGTQPLDQRNPEKTSDAQETGVDIDLQKLASEVSDKVKSSSIKSVPDKTVSDKKDYKTEEKLDEVRKRKESENKNMQDDAKTDRLGEIKSSYLQEERFEDVDEIIHRVKKFQSVYVVSSRELTPVRISLRDVSRIVCPGKVEGKVFSGEKPIEVKEFYDSLYVKNLPVKKDGEYVYDRGPKDLMVICEGKQVFSLLLIPDDVPSVTVYLQSSSSLQIQKAIEFETENSYIESVLKLVKHIYNNEVPSGYEIEGVNRVFKEYNEATLIHRLNWLGGIFAAEEYILQAKKDILTDEAFWINEIGNPENMVAITVVDHELKAGHETRIIVVRKRE